MQPKTLDLGEDTPSKPPKRAHVIKGTCPICGCVPGCENRDLTSKERQALLELGYKVEQDVFGRDIAMRPKGGPGWFNQALFEYHKAGHPTTDRPTWHERLLKGDL